jgi:hypothetical protein
MANNAAWNPVYVDTAPFVWNPNAAGLPGIIPLRIETIVWSGYTANANKAVIKDANGHMIWNASGYAADFQQESPKIGWVNGLQVTELDEGVLQIYLGFKN